MTSIIDGISAIFSDGMGVIFATFFLVLFAEMGDKSQLLTMAFTTHYRFKIVAAGVVISIVFLNTVAVIMGTLVNTLIPINMIQFLASISFLIFGIISFKKDKEENEKERLIKFSPLLTVITSFTIAELGDKTQLTTMALSAKYQMPIHVLIGATAAMIVADVVAGMVGMAVNRYISQRYIKIISGMMFIGFGLFGLSSSMPPGELSKFIENIALMLSIISMAVVFFILLVPTSARKAKR